MVWFRDIVIDFEMLYRNDVVVAVAERRKRRAVRRSGLFDPPQNVLRAVEHDYERAVVQRTVGSERADIAESAANNWRSNK